MTQAGALDDNPNTTSAQAAVFPGLLTLQRYPNNLPLQLSRFIGREREIAEIKQLIWSTRLLTLTGPGGCGKTRLALQVAADLLDAFADGVWLIELAALSDPALVPQAVVTALDVREPSTRPLLKILIDFLQSREQLLVLDNCEHLVLASAQLTEALLQACPSLRILTTSREALNIYGEIAWIVPSLSVPDPKTTSTAAVLLHSEAACLFVDRAAAAQSAFAANDRNAQAIAQICQRLDGIPLAIELAAARVRALSVEQIAARLDDRFDLLSIGSRTAPARHQTLRAMIDWSYSLLSPTEKMLFLRLAVFANGWTLEAAESVCSGGGLEPQAVVDVLTRLVDKSLVQAQDRDGETRFNMLVTIGQFARDRWHESNQVAAMRDRHVEYYLDLAEQADREIHGPNQIEWLDRLEIEHDNYRAALEWCTSNGQTEPVLRLLGALAWAWQLRGYFSEARSLFDEACALPGVADYPALYARVLNSIGRHEWWLTNYHDARSILDKSRAIWQTLDTEGERGLAEALTWLGRVTWFSELDRQTTQTFFEQGIALYRRCGDRWGLAEGLCYLGYHAELQHDDALALSWYEQSLALFRELGDLWGIGLVSHNLGRLSLQHGDYERAYSLYEHASTTDQRLRFKEGIASDLAELANVHRYKGDYDRAEEFYEKSLAVSREYGLKWDVAVAVYSLGLVALHRNDYILAAQYFIDEFGVHRSGTHTEAVNASDVLRSGERVDLLLGLAAVAAGTRQPERAAKMFGAAQAIIDAHGIPIKPFDRAEFDRHISLAREQLGKAAFEARQAEGRAMTLEQAVAYALSEPETSSPVEQSVPTPASPRILKQQFGGLTAREREVAALVAQGKSNRRIADILVVSEPTVATHVSNILSKLEFNSRTQIAAWAFEKGLTKPHVK